MYIVIQLQSLRPGRRILATVAPTGSHASAGKRRPNLLPTRLPLKRLLLHVPRYCSLSLRPGLQLHAHPRGAPAAGRQRHDAHRRLLPVLGTLAGARVDMLGLRGAGAPRSLFQCMRSKQMGVVPPDRRSRNEKGHARITVREREEPRAEAILPWSLPQLNRAGSYTYRRMTGWPRPWRPSRLSRRAGPCSSRGKLLKLPSPCKDHAALAAACHDTWKDAAWTGSEVRHLALVEA